MNIIIILAILIHPILSDVDLHMSERSKLMEEEMALAIGADIELNDKEKIVNNTLMQLKFEEIDDGILHSERFMYSHHYFTYKDKIKECKVYEIIRAMPKGALLHIHDMSILGPDYLLNITYMDHLYACFHYSQVKLLFSNDTPTASCSTRWQLMVEARKTANDTQKFDEDFKKYFTLMIDNPLEVYTDINAVWSVFQQIFFTLMPMLSYRPVWEQYFYDALKAMRYENIMYVEVRSVLPRLYELNGTIHNRLITAQTYKTATQRFVRDYPDFLGARLIFSPLRKVDRLTMTHYLEEAKIMKRVMPDFFAGFDLVGQEDLGHPTIEFISELIEARGELDYFFHAGETSWWQAPADNDLLDAVLLGARRLGHAYTLMKHPRLVTEVKKRGVALEAAVVSNSVLGLVGDVRNHPLSQWIAHGLPVVIASDDPGMWEGVPLSHDFHVVFMAVSARNHDLRMLKRLILNSIQYSAMDQRQKDDAFTKFQDRWNKFIDDFQTYNI